MHQPCRLPSPAPGICSRPAGGWAAADPGFVLYSLWRILVAGYFLVADVLGFTNVVSNLPHNTLNQQINNWIPLINSIKNDSKVHNVSTVSDTVFALEEDTADGLKRLLKFSRLLLERGLKNSFPIRGAITRGDVTWGDMIYGKPVIEAIELEKTQDWIGVACEVPLDSFPWAWDLACFYPVPQKSGPMKLHAVVIWDVPKLDKLVLKCIGGGQFKKEGEDFKWEIWNKIRNTSEFGLYLRKSRQKSHPPSTFDASESRIFSESK